MVSYVVDVYILTVIKEFELMYFDRVLLNKSISLPATALPFS